MMEYEILVCKKKNNLILCHIATLTCRNMPIFPQSGNSCQTQKWEDLAKTIELNVEMRI